MVRKPVDEVVLLAAGAIISTTVLQPLSSSQTEIGSEALCWIILPTLLYLGRPLQTNRYAAIPAHPSDHPKIQTEWSNSSRVASWLVALAITSISFHRAELGTNLLLPGLTPLLLAATGYLHPELKRWSQGGPLFSFSGMASSILGTAVIATAAILVLCEVKLDTHLVLSALPTTAMLFVYLALSLGSVVLDHGAAVSSEAEPSARRATSLFFPAAVLSALAFVGQTAYYGIPDAGAVVPILFLGLLKALSWQFTSRLARESSWLVAPVVATFAAVLSAHLSRPSSEVLAFLEIWACFFALSQLIGIIPRNTKGRWALWAFMAIPVAFSLNQISQIKRLTSSAVDGVTHPMEGLIQGARLRFQRLTEQQSQTLEMAVMEYKRRYKLDPPPGFEGWYKFAVENQSPIIDDFDVIHNSISPFLRLSGQDFTRAMMDTYTRPESDVWLCRFNGASLDTQCDHPLRDFDRNTALLFNTLLHNLTTTIPDVSFLVNHLDEPRVLIPPSGSQGQIGGSHIRLEDFTYRPTFESLTKYCPKHYQQDLPVRNSTHNPGGLPFVANTSSAMDLCQNSQYANQHGLFLSPASFRLVEGLVPILSTGAPSTMGDIVFPSPAYTVEEDFLYDAGHGVEWERKKNNLYWAGSTTGGYAADDSGWKDFHRQRFVALSQGRVRSYQYLREQEGQIKRVVSGFLNRRLFDVDFTRVFMCALRACRDEKDYFHAKSWADKDAALRSRLVFDLDGNGISGRYYKFLASRSAVLKQTLFREWHDDRLVPWVHYIPVSMGMEELPELVLWLTSTKLGQATAKEIADQGREWFNRALRPVDRAIYLYRLLLELGRLQDPTRILSQG